jgi:protein involved in polysaccharide export with SLBB domain
VRPAALGLFHPRGRLEQRVAGLLNPRRNVMVRTHRVTLAVLMALFLSAVVVVAGTRLLRAEPPGAPLAPADSKPPASPAAPAGLKPSVERDVASESPHRYLDVATIDYAGAPWGYDVKTHSDANTSETELSILFGTEQTASSPKEFRVLARDREGKLHEPRWLLFERGPMTATGAGRKVHTVTIVSRFSLPPKEIASLLIQQSAEPESPSKSAAEHAKAAANASPEQPPQDLHRIQPLDVLRIRALGTIEDQRIDGNFLVEPDGQVALGPSYGRAQVKGLTLEAAEKAIREKLKEVLAEPYVQVTLPIVQGEPALTVQWRGAAPPKAPYTISVGDLLSIHVVGTILDQPIKNDYLVEPAGTVPLGPAYGRVEVKGLTLEGAEKAIREKLKEILAEPYVQVTLAGWKNIVGPVMGPK